MPGAYNDGRESSAGASLADGRAKFVAIQIGARSFVDEGVEAMRDYSRLAKFSDFLKPCPCNNCAGPRFARYIENVHSTVFRDVAAEEVLSLHRWLLGYEDEATLDKLPTTGMSAGYVAREARRALAEVNHTVPIYPGIDIDIPTEPDEKKTQPTDVKAAVLAAFRAGAPGVVLSRKYAEMRLTNLAGAGEALRELK